MFGNNTDSVLSAAGLSLPEVLTATRGLDWTTSRTREIVDSRKHSGRALRALDFAHFRSRGIDEDEAAALADVTTNTAKSIVRHLSAANESGPAVLRPVSIKAHVVSILQSNPAASLDEIAEKVAVGDERLRRLLGIRLMGLIHDPAPDMYEHTSSTLYSDEDVFEALRSAAKEHGDVGSIPLAVYRESLAKVPGSRPSVSGITRRFGSWNTALEAAGLTTSTHGRTSYERKFSADGVTRAVAEFVLDHDGRCSAREYYLWAKGRDDVPRSIGIAARPRRWREVVADAYAMIRDDSSLATRHRLAVESAAENSKVSLAA